MLLSENSMTNANGELFSVTSISAAFCDIVASRRIVPRTAHKYTPAYMSGSEVTSYQSREPLYDRQAGM